LIIVIESDKPARKRRLKSRREPAARGSKGGNKGEKAKKAAKQGQEVKERQQR
jgi:hypothetical protein